MLNFSLSGPKNRGLFVTATTAFCTVLRVTSAGRSINSLELICLVHEMPKTDVAGLDAVAFRRSVK